MHVWLLFVFVSISHAIPVDNGVVGEPTVECGQTSITVRFNTRKPFEGSVFVKGQYDDDGCRVSEKIGGDSSLFAIINLPMNKCNMARTRSLSPRGMYLSSSVIMKFHPYFITKVDRAYRIQCFYMEADKTVGQGIEVADITTSLHTRTVNMPVCRYEILDGGPNGQPVQFTLLGQQVYHKWTCDSETVDTFCAIVHSCFVDDNHGNKIEIINYEGCAFDKYLLNNLEYPTDLMAGQEAHVYKYADRSEIFYQCQISITIKSGDECKRPVCPEPQGFGAVKSGAAPAPVAAPVDPDRLRNRIRRKRNLNSDEICDLRTSMSILDVLDKVTTNIDSNPVRRIQSIREVFGSMHYCNDWIRITGFNPISQPQISAFLILLVLIAVVVICKMWWAGSSKIHSI